MEANFAPRLKRKDYEDVVDDFSDFTFTSPATKIRRLDAELPPMVIVEEEPEVAAAPTFDQPQRCDNSGGLKIEELPNLGENEERAIVLFNPNNTTPIVHSPSDYSVSIDPRFFSGLKNKILGPSQANSWRWRVTNDEDATEDDSSSSGNGCQAVVPWCPPWFPTADADDSPNQFDSSDMMDAEEMGEAAMDVEDSMSIQNEAGSTTSLSQGFPQWQHQHQHQHQQHCTILQPPQNTTTPIVWYR